jgi:hypothetical protein
MSADHPPPIPPQTPWQPPQPPPPVNMKPRWIAWIAASILMPALPWLTMSNASNNDGTSVIVLTALALVLQLTASIALAIGFSRRRLLGVGGAIGMTVVFMLASVAIGTAIWLAACAGRLAIDA